MKGLLLKDWYMMKKYCRAYLLIAVVFIAVSLGNEYQWFAHKSEIEAQDPVAGSPEHCRRLFPTARQGCPGRVFNQQNY